MLVSSVVALLATAASVVSADYPSYNLIKTDRDAGRFTFVPTTRAQKEITLKNAENVLAAWVNYDSKMANYGSAADPFPIIKSRTALRYIGTIYGSVDRLPTEDSISLEFKSRAHYNHKYTIAVPYVTGHSRVCWELSSTLYQKVTNITLPDTPTSSSSFAPFDIAEYERQKMIDAEDAIRNPVAINAVHAEMANVQKELFQSASASADTNAFEWTKTSLKDIVVRARWSDLQPNSTTNTQYDRIADNLSRIGKANGQANTMFVAEPFSMDANLGDFKLDAEVSGIEDITITSDDGKKVFGTQKLTLDHHNVTITTPPISDGIGTQRITIIGSTKGKQIIKTYRTVRVVPTDEQRVHIATTPFTFNGKSTSVGLFNSAETAPVDGWSLHNGKWMVGNGTLYNNNVVTSLEVFMTAPVGTHVNFNLDVNLDCETEFDYLGLLTKSDNKETPILTTVSRLVAGRIIPGVSGRNTVVKGAYPFTTTTENFSVILRFTSDVISGFKGATINSFTASAATAPAPPSSVSKGHRKPIIF
ncbi:hypothetical protein BDV3_001897 [Batrachochytrium dendrobatidis]